MSFRNPFPNKKRAHDDDTSGRTADKESPLPAPDNLPNEGDLAEMRDNGHASQAAMWAEVRRIGLEVMAGGAKSEPDPTITHKEGSAVASALLDAHAAISKAAVALKLEGNIDVHLIFEGMLTACSDAGSRVADRWES